MKNRKQEILKALSEAKKSNPRYRKDLGGKIQDIVSDMNIRANNEEGVTKFEGGNGDFTFEGTAEKGDVNLTGQYKGIEFFANINYEKFVQDIYTKVSSKIKETAQDLNIDKETVHDMAVGLLATIAKEEGITEQEIEEAVEGGDEQEYNTLVQYKNTEGTLSTLSDIVNATSEEEAERKAEEKVRTLDNFVAIDNIKVGVREETEEEIEETEGVEMAKGGKATKKEKEDTEATKELVSKFLDRFGDKFNLLEHSDEIYKKVKGSTSIYSSAKVFIGFGVRSNIPDKLVVGQTKPSTGYIVLSSDINPNGVGDGQTPEVARTWTINLEIKGKKRYTQRAYEEGTYAKSYNYARTIDGVIGKFEDYYMGTFQNKIKNDDLKFDGVTVFEQGGQMKKGGKIWESLDFDNIEQYYDYIHESKVNGQHGQVRDLVNKMDENQKRGFFTYARQNGYDETINWINEKMAKGGGVTDERVERALQGYAEAALWSSINYGDDYPEGEEREFDDKYAIIDIDAPTMDSMRRDVRKFYEENIDLIEKSGLSDDEVGHDFWLTRHHHGAGFWDRGLGQVGKDLTTATEKYKDYLLYAEDGKVKAEHLAKGGKAGKGKKKNIDKSEDLKVKSVTKYAMHSGKGKTIDYDKFVRLTDADDYAQEKPLSAKELKDILNAFEPDLKEDIDKFDEVDDIVEDLREKEIVKCDNTYNRSYWGNAIIYCTMEIEDEKRLVFLAMHISGDVRGNYKPFKAYVFDNIEDEPYYQWKLYVDVDTNKGLVTLDAEDDEAYHFIVGRDPKGIIGENKSIDYQGIKDKLGVDIWMADGGEAYAKGGSVDLLKEIKAEKKISKQQINLINNRMNNNRVDAGADELIQWIWDNKPELTDEQNKKGLDFLMNLWKTPKGVERKNNPFGYREQKALDEFSNFELAGFKDISKYGGRKFYVPLYNVIAKDGYGFQYYYDGAVHIVAANGGQLAKGGFTDTVSTWWDKTKKLGKEGLEKTKKLGKEGFEKTQKFTAETVESQKQNLALNYLDAYAQSPDLDKEDKRVIQEARAIIAHASAGKYKFTNTAKAKTDGASRKGNIHTTYHEIEKVFGAPTFQDSDVDAKSKFQWHIKFDDGLVAIISDWKVNKDIYWIKKNNRKWSVGSKKKEAVKRIADMLGVIPEYSADRGGAMEDDEDFEEDYDYGKPVFEGAFVFDDKGEDGRYTVVIEDTGDIYSVSYPHGINKRLSNVTDRQNITFGYGWKKGHDAESLNRILKSELGTYLSQARGDSSMAGKEVRDEKDIPEKVKKYIKGIDRSKKLMAKGGEITFQDFKEGITVKVDEAYLNDEASPTDASATATVISEPSDAEELVHIKYENGTMDYVGQDWLTPIEGLTQKEIKKRLEHLRKELRAERIGYGELAELQSLAKHIDPSDVELLEAAGVSEFPDDDDSKAKGGKAKAGFVIISNDSRPDSPLYLGHSLGGRQVQWVEEWRKPITFSSEKEAKKFLDTFTVFKGKVIPKSDMAKTHGENIHDTIAYWKDHDVKTKKDIQKFLDELVEYLGLGFHPDTPFEDYENMRTKEATFTPDEYDILNKRMNQAFDVADKEKFDIYEIALKKLQKKFPEMFSDAKMDEGGNIKDAKHYLRYALASNKSAQEYLSGEPNIDKGKKELHESQERMEETMDVLSRAKGGTAFVPKSQKLKAFRKKIDILKESLDSTILSPETKDAMRKNIGSMEKEYEDMTKKVSIKEKMAIDKGKFYIKIPTDVKQKMYDIFRDKGIKVKWATLGDETKIIVNTNSKLKKVYDAYAKMLQKSKKEVPALDDIKGTNLKVKEK